MKGSVAVAIPLWIILAVGAWFLWTRVLHKSA